jgi:hypothetical protein
MLLGGRVTRSIGAQVREVFRSNFMEGPGTVDSWVSKLQFLRGLHPGDIFVLL